MIQTLPQLVRHNSRFVLVVAALVSAVVIVVAAVLYHARQTDGAAAAQSADSIAAALQRDIERTVDIVDLELLNAQAVMSRLRGSDVSADQLRSILFDGLKRLDHFGTMLVVDETGRALFDSGAISPRQRDYAAREWFTVHRDRADAGLFMSLVPHSALTGRPVIVLSRRLTHADGSFAGTVDASLEMSLFQDLFGSLDLTPGSDAALVTNDGRMIFRRSNGSRAFGQDVHDSPVSRAMAGQPGPTLTATSLTGVARLYAHHALRNISLTVFVGLSLKDIYQTWWIEAGTVGAAMATLLLVALVLVSLLRRELLRCEAVTRDAQRSEARYQFLAEHATDVVTCLDMGSRRTYVSPASRAILGYEPAEMLGAGVAGTIHPEDREVVAARFARLVSGQAERDAVTNRFRHKDGHYLWVEASLALVRDPATGEPNSIICCLRDISLRKAQADQMLAAAMELARLTEHLQNARDAAERASQAKSRFLDSISHELRTPLNGILGYAELLRIEGGLSASQAPRVEAMMAAGKHLLEMINRVLDLTEIETGHCELRQDAIDVREVASASLDLLRPPAVAKALSLQLDIDAGVPRGILADATRLRQILLNLLGNAVKFTLCGSVTLRIEPNGRQRLRFAVADTGPGVAADQQNRLFRDFERLGEVSAVGVEGAGLGLALSARLASLMGGSLGYEDNPGGGSRFVLDLPFDEMAPDFGSDALDPAGDGVADAPTAAVRVLVVDDIAVNRDVAASFLAAAGHEVVCVEDGAQAVALAAETFFDVILMDVRMPGMDGLEATRRIRAMGGVHAEVPIVAMTAQAFTQQIEECRAAGMDGHLTKPFTQLALLQRVLEVTSGWGRVRYALRDGGDDEGAAEREAEGGDGEALDEVLFDAVMFDGAAACLSADKLPGALCGLIGRGTELLEMLRTEPVDRDALAMAAHSLAGSAGIFGFQRLCALGQRLEHAVSHDAGQVPAISRRFGATLEASIAEMRRLVESAAVAGSDRAMGSERATGDGLAVVAAGVR